jgi:hypothetical protein
LGQQGARRRGSPALHAQMALCGRAYDPEQPYLLPHSWGPTPISTITVHPPPLLLALMRTPEDLRNRELAERRKRLGLPEPKVAVTIAGPRQGKPPAPDEGDDGNGGWISAYEEILRAVMRDLRVYNTARRLHGGGAWLPTRPHAPPPPPCPHALLYPPPSRFYCANMCGAGKALRLHEPFSASVPLWVP